MLLMKSLLGGLDQAANPMDKNSEKFKGTLAHWKLLSRWRFLHALSISRIEQWADDRIVRCPKSGLMRNNNNDQNLSVVDISITKI